MKRLLIFILFLVPILSFGQDSTWAESHDFITYDTVFNGSLGQNWIIRISRPRTLFTANSPDTASRPAIITMPGQGEMGSTDTTNLLHWGPHYWLWKPGAWDGSVMLGNGKHYPILITITASSNPYPTEAQGYEVANYMISHYHVKRNAAHFGGLSQGSFVWTAMISYEVTTGNRDGQKLVTSLTALEGMVDNSSSAWQNFASLQNGKMFGLEGTADYRNVAAGEKDMNTAVRGSAYFSYQNSSDNQNYTDTNATATAGSHCCWNSMYNPKAQNWQSFAPMGPLNATGADTNSRGTYKIGSSIFQWMLRQGDTTMVNASQSSVPFHITKVFPAEYVTYYLCTDSNLYNINGANPIKQKPLPSGNRVLTASCGFNNIYCTAANGTVWNNYNVPANDSIFNQVTTDTTGTTITNAIGIWAWCNDYIILRSDSSAYLGGFDSCHILHTTGGLQARPTQIGTGIKWRKFAFGGPGRIVGLASNGDVWQFTSSTGKAGVKMTTPRGAIDIAASHLDYAVAIIPDVTGQNYGWPYVWGNSYGNWGGTAGFSQPTTIKSLWNMTVPISEINVNWQSTHYIDTAGNLWGIGSQVQGEVGNGVEFVNRYTYSTFPGYGWDFTDGENLLPAPPVQIGKGVRWKHLYGGNPYFGFYKYGQDSKDSIYSCGRNKSDVLGNGLHNLDEQNSPNALDVDSFTMVHPLAVNTVRNGHFTAPNIGAGANQTITTTSTTVTATGHQVLVINASNSADTLCCKVSSWLWTKVSGSSGDTIVTPTSKSTQIRGLKTGTYSYQVTMTDNNGGTDTGKLSIVVNASGVPPTVSAGPDQTIILPVDSVTLTGTAIGNGGNTISSIFWTVTQSPVGQTPTIVSPTTAITKVIHLDTPGNYVFHIAVTDSAGNTGADDVQVTVTTSGVQKLPISLKHRLTFNH